jgi:hypothetical protein
MRSPAGSAMRAVLGRPSLPLAEIAWRWSFAALAWMLAAFAALQYLDSLPIRTVDEFLLGTGNPLLVARALSHIVRGSGPRLALGILTVAAALLLVWVAFASVGRAATLADLTGRPPRCWNLKSILAVHFLRACLTFAALTAAAGVFILAGMAAPAEDVSPGISFQLWSGLLILLCLAWSVLNWMLSLAPIFVVRDSEDMLGAIRATVYFIRDRLPAICLTGALFGTVHLALFVLFLSMAFAIFAFAQLFPAVMVALVLCVLTLLYLALADWLYIARLAAYAAVAAGSPPCTLSPGAPTHGSTAFAPAPA